MAYLAGAALGVVWLWFWLHGSWFAALLLQLPMAVIWLYFDHFPGYGMFAIYFGLPWLPFYIHLGVTDWKAKRSLRLELR